MSSFFEGLGNDSCLYCGAALPDTFNIEIGTDDRSVGPATEYAFRCSGCDDYLFFYAMVGTPFRIPHQNMADNALREQGRPSSHEVRGHSLYHFAFTEEEFVLLGERNEELIVGEEKDADKLLDIIEEHIND